MKWTRLPGDGALRRQMGAAECDAAQHIYRLCVVFDRYFMQMTSVKTGGIQPNSMP
jgi:hypothetical protein